MEFNEFLTRIIELIIASIPQLVALLTVLLYLTQKVIKVTKRFPDEMEKTKETLGTNFKSANNLLKEDFSNISKQLMKIVGETNEELKKRTLKYMDDISNRLLSYESEIKELKKAQGIATQEFNAFIDIVSTLLSGDPELIQKGISSKLLTQLDVVKETIEKQELEKIEHEKL